MARINARLDRLEKSRGKYADIISLCREGAYWSELSEAQKELYAEYIGVEIAIVECLEGEFSEKMDFKLQPLKSKVDPTDVAEVEEIINEN